MGDPYEANRSAFSESHVVATYSAMADLTAAEQCLFSNLLQEGMDVLDLGVGAGRTTAALRSLGGRYAGVDYSSAMVTAARQNHPDTDIREGDASDLSDFDDQSFDAVVFSFNGIDNLFPAERRQRCLCECVRVLRAGGVCIFSSHNSRFLFRTFQLRGHGIVRVRSLAGGLYRSSRLATTRLTQRTLWSGRGYAHDPAHGGLVQYEALRRHVIAEASAAGLQLIDAVPSSYPRTSPTITVPWYYYAFLRR